LHREAERAGEYDRLALVGRHRRVRGMRSGQGRQPHPTHGERVRAAVGVGDEDAPRDLGRRVVVGRDGACSRVDAFNGGVEHRQKVWTRIARAIHQRDDSRAYEKG